ncbi:MAG: deoxyguanosinetriphosphate triphosphohydrolase [Pseudomonadota bacterium]
MSAAHREPAPEKPSAAGPQQPDQATTRQVRAPGPALTSATIASRPEASRGRTIAEPDCPMRSPFQRDRDRVIHSSAFRRLTYKTQVFVYHEGDHYRSRLTHSLEVAQVARALARMLVLDEDLTEAIALAHDLGHPPFGHTGERALDRALADAGGFDHNAQSLRVVTELEQKYALFDGMNLSWEVREGLVKHNGPVHETRSRFLADYIAAHDMQPTVFASAEAQAAAIADDIAYTNHDIDDGLRAGLLEPSDLRAVDLVGELLDEVTDRYGMLPDGRLVYEVNRRLMTRMIDDAVAETRGRVAAGGLASSNDVRAADQMTVTFSPRMAAQIASLRAFLYATVYRHPSVMRVMDDAEQIVHDLVVRFRAAPWEMSPSWASSARETPDTTARAQIVSDYVAGMTDRYALAEHRRLFDATPDLR